MSERQRGMGRGLAAILALEPRDDDEPRFPELRQIPLELITASAAQPRKHFDEEALVALAESLKARGVLQPVLVRPLPGGTYELVAGERRWRAAALAGLPEVPALVHEHTDAESLEVALVENMARQDLNPVEEARAVAALTEELGLTREEVGRRIGRSRVAVSNLVRLLDLPDEALDLLERGSLTEGHGRALLMAGDNGDRRRLARRAADAGWSVRVTEARAREAGRDQSPIRASRGGGTAPMHPDLVDALDRISDVLGAALGHEVRVRPVGAGCKLELRVDSLQEALALADRLSVSRAP